jgi:hypothetical protein
MRQMMDLGDMVGLTAGPSWEAFAPIGAGEDDVNDRPAGDTEDTKTT